MSMALLFDPLHPPAGAWPPDQAAERAYVEALARSPGLVANVRTRWLALRSGDRLLPVTVNTRERGDSYVCLPHSAYVLYGRRELELVDLGPLRPVLQVALLAVDLVLRAMQINRIVHIDNWLLSTNLHGDWDGSDLPQLRPLVTVRWPRHFLGVRSVDPWSSPQLEQALRADGWVMLPSRQIWVTDDPARDWRRSKAAGSDRAALARGALRVETLTGLQPGDADRIARLYHMLYTEKYSALNPGFTADWIRLTHACGLIRYHVARDAAGTIQSVAGTWARAGVLTTPVVGYDTGRPVREGLYRIATVLLSQAAVDAGCRLNGSAGAAEFKRTRGARPVIECTAIWAAHLPWWRRWLLRLFAAVLWRGLVPVMRARQL